MREKILTDKQFEKRDKFTYNTSSCRFVKMSVWIVMKCNFNDEMLVETLYINVEDLINKPLVWYDLYLGRNKFISKKIAFSSLKNNKLTAIVDDGEIKKEYNLDSYDFFVDDNDEKSLITCKISMHEKKESW